MIDLPGPEVKTSIQKTKSTRITFIMITGDHKNTMFTIALEPGMASVKNFIWIYSTL
jgi:magnesium-transporting ATPase (P-type)